MHNAKMVISGIFLEKNLVGWKICYNFALAIEGYQLRYILFWCVSSVG